MVNTAVEIYGEEQNRRFIVARSAPRRADYTIASGVFNVKMCDLPEAWERYVAQTLCETRETSRKGFAVNFIGSASRNGSAASPHLYRVAPEHWFYFLENHLKCETKIIIDYGLTEFTLLARCR